MADRITPAQRSWIMSRIRGRDTKPERLVRSMLHRAGYRFRKNVGHLPGKPDVVLPKYRTVIFVNGCFWHRHKNCRNASTPKSNVEFWQAKFDRNVANDKRHARRLRRMGWHVLTVWECELKKPEKVLARLRRELSARKPGDAGRIVRYPTAEDDGLPMAAEGRAEYRTK